MFMKTSGVIAAGATLAVLAVGGSAVAIRAASSGFATGTTVPSAPPAPAGSPATAAVPGSGGPGTTDGQGPGGRAGTGQEQPGAGTGTPGAGLAAVRAATAALPHSPRLLQQMAGPVSRGRRGARATGTSVPGIDVAAFQHPGGMPINWAAVAAAGYKFAAVKATEGNYYVNPWAATDLAAAKKAGLFVTAYHFAIPNASGGASQAQYAVRHAGYATGAQMLPLMLDIEYDPYVSSDHTNECYGLSAARMRSWLAAFVAEARSLTGQFPVIYTTADWWGTCTGASTAFGADPMWVAAYGFASPPMPAGWPAWTFWQYASTGTVRGVDSPGSTDLSVFNTSLVGLIDPGSQSTSTGAKVSLAVGSLEVAGRRPLSYTATGLPPGLTITAVGTITGVVTGPPATYQVTISAKNPAAATGSVSFTWRVTGTAVPSPSPSASPSASRTALRTGRDGGRGRSHPGAQGRVSGPVRPRLHHPQAGP